MQHLKSLVSCLAQEVAVVEAVVAEAAKAKRVVAAEAAVDVAIMKAAWKVAKPEAAATVKAEAAVATNFIG